jgi:hypothetical protein
MGKISFMPKGKYGSQYGSQYTHFHISCTYSVAVREHLLHELSSRLVKKYGQYSMAVTRMIQASLTTFFSNNFFTKPYKKLTKKYG